MTFEEMIKEEYPHSNDPFYRSNTYLIRKKDWNAGYAAGKERAAEIAEKFRRNNRPTSDHSPLSIWQSDIAESIRRDGV
jgi:hypothetical protein